MHSIFILWTYQNFFVTISGRFMAILVFHHNVLRAKAFHITLILWINYRGQNYLIKEYELHRPPSAPRICRHTFSSRQALRLPVEVGSCILRVLSHLLLERTSDFDNTVVVVFSP